MSSPIVYSIVGGSCKFAQEILNYVPVSDQTHRMMTVALGAMGAFAFEWTLLSFIQKQNFPIDIKLLEIFNAGCTSVFSGISLVLFVSAIKQSRNSDPFFKRLEKISYAYYQTIALMAFVVTAGTLLFQKKINRISVPSLLVQLPHWGMLLLQGEFPVHNRVNRWKAIEHLVEPVQRQSIDKGYCKQKKVIACIENVCSRGPEAACANILIIGPTGSGKSTILEYFYELYFQGAFQGLGPNCLFLKAETDALCSPRNIKMIFDFLKQEAKERGSKCVLIVDEFHRLGSNVQELLPHIEDPNVIVIGAMTDEDYQTFLKSGVTQAFYSRFEKIPIRLNNEIRTACFKAEFAKIKEAHLTCQVPDGFETKVLEWMNKNGLSMRDLKNKMSDMGTCMSLKKNWEASFAAIKQEDAFDFGSEYAPSESSGYGNS